VILRAVVFAVAFVLLQLSWQGLRGTVVERVVVQEVTVRSAVLLVNALTPDVHARGDGISVRARGGGLRIENGCEGMEVWFLLFAAFLVAPLPRKSRCLGFLLGTAVVFIVNQLRILALFYANRDDHALFDLLHATVTPVAVILLVAGYFYVWLIFSARRPAAAT
jgi:exosortase/archaeosortase family protein